MCYFLAAYKYFNKLFRNLEILKINIIESNRMKSNRIASLIIESNREVSESFRA